MSVAKLTRDEFATYMKYKGKRIYWKHPMSDKEQCAYIVGIQDGFLLAKDSVATEGILESWITYVSTN
jgi:hypothetical protein